MGFRVLVVDDAETNRAILNEILASDGYRVSSVDGGLAALSAIEADPPDLVLLDVMMPDISGIDVCRRIRATPAWQDIAIVLVTALADRQSRLAGFEAGADDYLTKPIDATELRLRVRTMSRLRRYRNLLEERSRVAMITDQMPDPVLLCDRDGVILDANPAARALFVGATQMDGSPLTEVATVADAADHAWLAGSESTERGAPRDIVMAIAGRERVMEVSRTWHRWRERDVAIVIARDVTELERLRSTSARLRRNEAIATAAAGIAHDFRNYLTAIQLGTELLGEVVGAQNASAQKIVGNIQRQINVGLGLTNRITSVSRGLATETEAGDLDLCATIKEMEPLIRHWAGRTSFSIELGEAPIIRGTREDIVQIVSNLVVNAGQAVDERGLVVLRVRSEDAGSGPMAVLEVADNGTGMDAATRDRIFEAYFSTKTATGGTGLGLATVFEIVNRRGASIDVSSTVGEGSTFTVRWPATSSVG